MAKTSGNPVGLAEALRAVVRHPLRTLVPVWSWKAAVWSAALRAMVFFVTNRHAGTHKALHAMAVEGVFAIFAAGTLGAVSQILRNARPEWATVLFVWLAMPAATLLAEYGVHRVAGTEHMGTGLLISFGFASLACAFSWFAMRHGVLLGGDENTSVAHDLKALPFVLVEFVLAVPRAILRRPGGD